jgi:predicted lipoprotein with Yx(FWY)xxD motif
MIAHLLYKKSYWFVSVLTLGLLFLAACQPQPSVPVTGGAATSNSPAPQAAAPQQVMPAATAATIKAAASSEAVINVAMDPKFGKILVGNNGMTLYMFTKDGPNQSNCSGGCMKYWPPLLTQGSPDLGEGIDKSLVSSAPLANGSMIVTYNKMPLYYWVKDSKPGDTTGQNVDKAWYVVSPDGKVLGMPDASGTSANSAVVPAEPMITAAADSKLGQILVGDKGMTLYVFAKDSPNQSNCTGNCLMNWPPLLTHGNPTLGAGIDKSLLGSAALADGTQIVTYNKMPLYYFIKDTKPGDTNGQNVGKLWSALSPNGKPAGMVK